MLRWTEFLALQERYEDLRREAERDQLVRQILAEPERRDRFYDRALARLGGRLVTWGCRLQERCGMGSRAYTVPSVCHTRETKVRS